MKLDNAKVKEKRSSGIRYEEGALSPDLTKMTEQDEVNYRDASALAPSH